MPVPLYFPTSSIDKACIFRVDSTNSIVQSYINLLRFVGLILDKTVAFLSATVYII